MTCIVGMIDEKGNGHIACDSLGSNGYTKSIYKNQKIFRKGGLLIGYTSSYRMGQILEHQLILPDRKVEQTIDNWVYVDLANAIRTLLKNNGYLKIDNNRESIGEFIIIGDGRLFVVQDDLAILESKELFDSCGSGANHAIATLYNLIKYTKFLPKRLLTEAVETAGRYVPSVGGDICYLEQE